MSARIAFVVLFLLTTSVALAETPVEAARALIARYHEDQANIDRARDLLEAALSKDRQVETMVMLSYVQFLWGDLRAKNDDDKLAAYDHGRQAGERAGGPAPKNPRAHSLAGNVYMTLPRIAGGDAARAEEHFKKGLAIDPRFTVLRVDLARLYIATGRNGEARQELTRVLDERAPRIMADWTVR